MRAALLLTTLLLPLAAVQAAAQSTAESTTAAPTTAPHAILFRLGQIYASVVGTLDGSGTARRWTPGESLGPLARKQIEATMRATVLGPATVQRRPALVEQATRRAACGGRRSSGAAGLVSPARSDRRAKAVIVV